MNQFVMNFNSIHRILERLDKTNQKVITVFGDYCLDRYAYSDPLRDEKSLETGLPAYQVHKMEAYPGIGGTITNNLRSLGAEVFCVGLLGQDGDGFQLKKMLNAMGANTSFMVETDSRMTNVYLKLMRGAKKESSAESNRLDFRSFEKTSQGLELQLLKNLEKAMAKSHAVLVTDQFLEEDCSVVTNKIRKELSKMAKENPNKIFYVDSRGFADHFPNFICKCNDKEFQAIGINNNHHMDGFLQRKNIKAFYITKGDQGIVLLGQGKREFLPAVKATLPIDICGAGDATNAGIVLGLTLDLSLEEAGLLGATVSSLTIEQIGTTGCTSIIKVKERLSKFL